MPEHPAHLQKEKGEEKHKAFLPFFYCLQRKLDRIKPAASTFFSSSFSVDSSNHQKVFRITDK